MFPQSISRTRTQAFTLVEITLALGIVAFAVIVSFGLVSTATQSFHETRRDTVYANILQYAAANANLTPFSNLGGSGSDGSQDPSTTFDGKLWKFDMEGLPLKDGDTTPATYYAKVLVSNPPLLPAQELSSTKTRSVITVISDSGIKIPTSITSPVGSPEELASKIPKALKEHIVPFYIVVGDMGK